MLQDKDLPPITFAMRILELLQSNPEAREQVEGEVPGVMEEMKEVLD